MVHPIENPKAVFLNRRKPRQRRFFSSLFSLCAPVQNPCVQRYMAKKEKMPVMEQDQGRYWGVIGREHLPPGKREDREVTASEAVKLLPVMRRYRVANTLLEKRKYLRKSQLWSEDFTSKLFCNVEFWLERLPKLIEPQPSCATSA